MDKMDQSEVHSSPTSVLPATWCFMIKWYCHWPQILRWLYWYEFKNQQLEFLSISICVVRHLTFLTKLNGGDCKRHSNHLVFTFYIVNRKVYTFYFCLNIWLAMWVHPLIKLCQLGGSSVVPIIDPVVGEKKLHLRKDPDWPPQVCRKLVELLAH